MPKLPPSLAVRAADLPARARPSNYPLPFSARMAGREKRQLGDEVGYPDEDLRALLVDGQWQDFRSLGPMPGQVGRVTYGVICGENPGGFE